MWEIRKLFQIEVSGPPGKSKSKLCSASARYVWESNLLALCMRCNWVLTQMNTSNEWTIASSQLDYFEWRFQMLQLIRDVKCSLQRVWKKVWEIQVRALAVCMHWDFQTITWSLQWVWTIASSKGIILNWSFRCFISDWQDCEWAFSWFPLFLPCYFSFRCKSFYSFFLLESLYLQRKGGHPLDPVLLFLFSFLLLPFLFILSLNLRVEENVRGTQQRPSSTSELLTDVGA